MCVYICIYVVCYVFVCLCVVCLLHVVSRVCPRHNFNNDNIKHGNSEK